MNTALFICSVLEAIGCHRSNATASTGIMLNGCTGALISLLAKCNSSTRGQAPSQDFSGESASSPMTFDIELVTMISMREKRLGTGGFALRFERKH